ncbi:MAG TPA: helix-turn-helix domain-containing protein [Staphylococcus sp.]|nr:helix-turn-helix domain-containing protein [Staphylococcus sp.]
MILIPLGKPCKINLNGSIITLESGVIINNADLYQIIDAQDLLELNIPLPLFIEKDACLSNAFFDFNQIRYIDQFRNLILEKLCTHANDKNTMSYYISNIIDFLLKEAKVTLQHNYIPPLHTKHPLVYRLTQYIHKNIYDTLTTKQVSQIFFISQSYISILFSKTLNMNFKNYTSTLKIALSIFDLIQENQDICDVAIKYKFMNVSTYSKHFKHYTGMPPKSYIHQFRKGHFNNPYQLAINVPNLSNYFAKLYNTNFNSTCSSHVLNISELTFNQRFDNTFVVVRLDDLYHLLKFSRNTSNINIFLDFSKVNLLVNHTDVEDLNELETQQCLETITSLIKYGYYLTFKVTHLNLSQTFDYHLLKALQSSLSSKKCLKQIILLQIILLFDLDSNSVKNISMLIKNLKRKYPLLNLAMVIDPFLENENNLMDCVKLIKSMPVDYYYINNDLITLGNILSEKLVHSHSTINLKQIILLFLQQLGYKFSNKLIFNHITHNALKAYFNNATDATHILLTELIVELNALVGGFGFAYYTDDQTQFMLINRHLSAMPIVHIYSLLKPFLEQSITILPYGVVAKTKSHYHFLMFNNQDYTLKNSIHININHHFSNDFPVFMRQLNHNHGMISQLISRDLNQKYINPDILKQINKTNYPLAKLHMHSCKNPIALTLTNSTILYLMIPIRE